MKLFGGKKEKEEMDTLVSVLARLTAEGYEKQFRVSEEGLEELASGKTYTPDKVRVTNFYRFEGISDPADNSILYAIETSDGERGTLVDAYGAYSNELIAGFMEQVETIQKKTQRDPPV